VSPITRLLHFKLSKLIVRSGEQIGCGVHFT